MANIAKPRVSPNKVLLLIGLTVLSEPLQATLLLPFVYFMVKDFGYGIDQIGARVGLITSCFFFAQMCSTSFWGWMSDRFGRKAILLVGLAGGALSMLSFGVSNSVIWAGLSRSICGALNGNVGVARTAVGELAEQHKLKQSRAFSLFGFCSALGFVLGPLIGGALANPAVHLGFRGPGDIFVQYPYMLPCLTSATFNICVFTLTLILLPETNMHYLMKRKISAVPDVEGAPVQPVAEDPLLSPDLESVIRAGEETDVESVGTEDTEETPLLSPTSSSLNKQLIAPEDGGETASAKKLNSASIACIVATGCIALHAIIFDEGYSLFAASSLADGTGLSFASPQIAVSLSLMGLVIFLAQLVIYPFLNARVGTLTLWRWSAVAFALVYPLFSLVPLVSHEPARWALLIVLLSIRFTMVVLGYTALNILINHVTDPQSRGLVNGLVQSMASAARAVGPTVGGFLWSWTIVDGLPPPFDFHAFFILLSVIAGAQWVVGAWIPKEASSKN